ncbi:MAG TPA: hypothetical protein PLZ79_01425 [Burkholderiales bacterium]|nr:hypothetical protein [Burkholderiales bacterium]
MDMSIVRFLEIVKSGWDVQIGTQSEAGQITTARIQAATSSKFVDVPARNGLIADEDVFHALEFLLQDCDRRSPETEPEWSLLKEVVEFSPDLVDLVQTALPEGWRYAKEQDGSYSIVDGQGTKVGTIDKGASIARAGEAVVSAIAQSAANGMSSETEELPASSQAMRDSATVGAADVDALIAGLKDMPDAKRPVDVPNNPAQIRMITKASIAERQRTLLSEVNLSLTEKFGWKGKVLHIDTLAEICKRNFHTLEITPDGYLIRQPDGLIAAAGELRRNYLTTEAVESLRDQLDDADQGNVLAAYAPDALAAVEAASTTIRRFAEANPITRNPPHTHTDPPHTDPPHTDPPHTDPPHTDPPHTDPPEGPGGRR